MAAQRSSSQNTLRPEFITVDDVLGKTVIDADGDILGVTNQLLISPDSFKLLGISVDKGFLHKGLLIGREHVDKVEKHAIFLNMVPALTIKGFQVFDSVGETVGRVREVRLEPGSNVISELVVDAPTGYKVSVPRDAIGEIGKNVLLKVRMRQLRRPEP